MGENVLGKLWMKLREELRSHHYHDGFTVADLRAVKRLVDKIGADTVRRLACL